MNDNNIGRTLKGFQPGNPGKPKGSSKNKQRELVREFINEKWNEFPVWFDELKAKDKINTILDLLPYSLSRLSSISITDSDGNQIEEKVSIDYTKLSEATLKEILSHTTIEQNEENL